MEALEQLKLLGAYRTGQGDPVSGFYKPCLQGSTAYCRAAGYFRSTIFHLIGPDLVDFAKRGGKMTLVCSPSLSAEDIEAIRIGTAANREAVERSLLEDLTELLNTPQTHYRTKAFATLLTHGVVSLKIAVPALGHGIYHEKLGVFSSAKGAAVSFIGSSNETLSAWSSTGNFESIEVFCSWASEADRQRVERHQKYLEMLWENSIQGVEVFDPPESFNERLKTVSDSSIDVLDMKILSSVKLKRTLFPHQQNAIDAWVANNRRGVLEHATGSGKTFTAISAVRSHVASGLPALIVVPSVLLLDQWRLELLQECPESALLSAGGTHQDWKKPGIVEVMTANEMESGARITIATLQTASSLGFLGRIRGGSHLMIVADEVHTTGSPHYSRLMGIDSGPRLGLSATPTRFGDPDGTARITAYFGNVLQPPFTLADAIRSGRLVRYEYFPHEVRLDQDETKKWIDLTKQIGAEISSKDDGSRLSELAKLLIIKRSRIAKKAEGKIGLAVRVLKNNFKEGERWLVYCEDSAQLQQVKRAIEAEGLQSTEYHTQMEGDRSASLKWFIDFGGILVSIKCLDEGIDIPTISHALILASSQNPRQFIQRRGRVLRVAPGKNFAVLHDAIVLPHSIDDVKSVKSLMRTELARALVFAEHAFNQSAKLQILDSAAEMEINLHVEDSVELEDDDVNISEFNDDYS